MTKRTIFAAPIFVLAAFFILLAIFSANGRDHVALSFERSREIERSFRIIGAYTEKFRSENNRLPSADEFEKWAGEDRFPLFSFGKQGNLWTSENGEACLTNEPSSLPAQPYLLCYWRGEWTEEFSPVTQQSTLPKSIHEYSTTGRFWLDTVLWVMLAAAALVAALVVRNYRPRHLRDKAGCVAQ